MSIYAYIDMSIRTYLYPPPCCPGAGDDASSGGVPPQGGCAGNGGGSARGTGAKFDKRKLFDPISNVTKVVMRVLV